MLGFGDDDESDIDEEDEDEEGDEEEEEGPKKVRSGCVRGMGIGEGEEADVWADEEDEQHGAKEVRSGCVRCCGTGCMYERLPAALCRQAAACHARMGDPQEASVSRAGIGLASGIRSCCLPCAAGPTTTGTQLMSPLAPLPH